MWLTAGSALFAIRASAADRNEPVQEDADFLEYLGSVESDQENWTDFEASEAKSDKSGAQGKAPAQAAKPADRAGKDTKAPASRAADSEQKSEK